MGFFDKLGKVLGDMASENRKEVGRYMRQYERYPAHKLEEIRSNSRYSINQRGAADNLLKGERLHLMNER